MYMKFGNWNVSEAGIEWAGSGLQRFFIHQRDLTEITTGDEEEADMYKWILSATEEDWLTDDDLYDLNFAFVYAVAHARLNFDYEVFDQTVAYQFETLDEEESEQPSLDIMSPETAEAEQQRKDALTGRD